MFPGETDAYNGGAAILPAGAGAVHPSAERGESTAEADLQQRQAGRLREAVEAAENPETCGSGRC